MEPMVHYLPLRKDFSNFDEVLRAVPGSGVRRELTENAHRDLIASGRYSYERFIESFDQDMIEAGVSPDVSDSDAALTRTAVNRGRRRRELKVQLRWISRTRVPGYLLGNLFKATGFLRRLLTRASRPTGSDGDRESRGER